MNAQKIIYQHVTNTLRMHIVEQHSYKPNSTQMSFMKLTSSQKSDNQITQNIHVVKIRTMRSVIEG